MLDDHPTRRSADRDGRGVEGALRDVRAASRPQPSCRRAPRSGRRAASSSSCEPCSTTRPCSRTTIMLAPRIVERRWAMMNAVRPCRSRRSACSIRCSVAMSTELVASSRIRIARIGEQRPRERDELALTEREAEAALAELGVVAVLEPRRRTRRPRPRARRRRSPRGRRPDGRRRCCRRPCRRRGSPPAARSRAGGGATPGVRRAGRSPSTRDRAAGRVVEPGDQLRDRRLPGAGVADERDRRPGAGCRGRCRAAPRARCRR